MNIASNLQDIDMASVRDRISGDKSLSPATIKDYLAQIDRCLGVFNVNELSAITIDVTDFRIRFPSRDFPRDHFKTVKAYQAWRKKMVSAMKRASGVAAAERERRFRDDEWSRLLEIYQTVTDSKERGAISLAILADEARRADRNPRNLDADWLDQLCDVLRPGRREAIYRALRHLETCRVRSREIDRLLPQGPLTHPIKFRRRASAELPIEIAKQLQNLIGEHCDGDYDEILEEHTDAKSKPTRNTYIAAAKKYLASALRCGALDRDCGDLSEAFAEPVFTAVMRDWIGEQDLARQISDRTKRSYVSNIMSLAVTSGMPVHFMKAALHRNRILKRGREAEKEMAPKTREFCSRLLRRRHDELTFKSLHLRFQERAIDFLATSSPGRYSEDRIIQLGVMAAFSAIALWGVPLRIENMRQLRHRGNNPTLILPRGSRNRAHILIPGQDVKNGKLIRAQISDGPTRALEVLDWYLEVIRPRIPSADHSVFLFPGRSGRAISSSSLRAWLQSHSRDLNIPMNPHNFRHGLASLYLRDHPGEFGQVARLLCNTPSVVRLHYAWIDEEAEMRVVQQNVARMAGFGNAVL